MAIEERYDEILGAARHVIAERGFAQASIRQIARAAGLSLAGLYHYVGGKDELLFLVVDRALDELLATMDRAVAQAATPEEKLLTLIRAHLEFAVDHAPELGIIDHDYELLAEPRRSEVAAKRQTYLQAWLVVLRELDPHDRSGDELVSATRLLLGMLNGIATRPFGHSGDARGLAAEVAALFLYGFLERAGDRGGVPAIRGGEHDA